MKEKKKSQVDPLFQIFERFLMTRSFEDSTKFTKELAAEYLAYLDSTPAHVPYEARQNVIADLESEAHELLVKKMYGCVKTSDYQNFGRVVEVNENSEVTSFAFEPPAQPEESPPKK